MASLSHDRRPCGCGPRLSPRSEDMDQYDNGHRCHDVGLHLLGVGLRQILPAVGRYSPKYPHCDGSSDHRRLVGSSLDEEPTPMEAVRISDREMVTRLSPLLCSVAGGACQGVDRGFSFILHPNSLYWTLISDISLSVECPNHRVLDNCFDTGTL